VGDRGQDAILGLFEKGDYLSPLDRGEAVEKLVDGVTRFEVIHQRLYGDTSSYETGRAAHDFRVADDEFLLHGS
jgi:hypothetical protein